MKLPLRGIIPPVITPLLDNNTLDVKGLEKLVEHLISGGVHGLFILGTTGEAPSLSYELRKEFIKRTCELTNKRIPVMVGITDTSFEGSLEIAHYSKEVGADAVVVAPPFYMPISQDELVVYLENLIPKSPLPLLLYNMPSHTKLHMDIETVKIGQKLGAIGIKDSSGDMFYQTNLIEEFKNIPEFAIITGTELFIPETILQGGHGAIAGGANIYPKLFVEMYDASIARDFEKIAILRELNIQLYNTIYAVSGNSSKYIRGLKCVLATMGICNDYAALPLSKYEGEDKKKIEEYVAHFKGIIA
ncbi:MAG: dihydrodipicolinate synthase family protein [Mariniphaga sp.]